MQANSLRRVVDASLWQHVDQRSCDGQASVVQGEKTYHCDHLILATSRASSRATAAHFLEGLHSCASSQALGRVLLVVTTSLVELLVAPLHTVLVHIFVLDALFVSAQEAHG